RPRVLHSFPTRRSSDLLTVALVFYLNFKWGYSQAFGGPGLEHEVRERDYFFIASFAAWGVWVGMGIATLMEWIDEALGARAARPDRKSTRLNSSHVSIA